MREKVLKRFLGLGAPDGNVIRACLQNVHYHMDYVGYLTERRRWLAGDEFSYADISAAAHFSCLDYLGDAPWGDHILAKDWYMRVKSRPSFRPLLATGSPVSPPPSIMRILTSDQTAARPRDAITAKAKELGFRGDRLYTRPTPGPGDRAHLDAFLADGRHGDMAWMAETFERRAAPTAMWPEARSRDHARCPLHARKRSAGRSRAARSRRDFGLCPGQGLS